MKSQIFKLIDDVNKLCLRFEIRVDGEEEVYEVRWMQEAKSEKKAMRVRTCLEDNQMRVIVTCREEEAVLCTIRHVGSYLEMTPGFSQLEDPLFDQRWSTYTASTDGGKIVEYSIHNGAAPTEEELDRLYYFRRQQDALQKALKEESWKDAVGGAKRIDSRERAKHDAISLRLEIQTTSGFDHSDWLFVDFEVHLPRGWCGLGESWTCKDEEFTFTGRTQISRNAVAPEAQREDDGDISILIVFVLFVVGLLSGPTYALWLVFGAVLFCLDHRSSLVETNPRRAHFNFPVELEFYREDETSKKYPMIYIQVTSKQSFERYVVEGYAYARLDGLNGRSDKSMLTWRPSSTIRRHVQDFFLGGGHRLADIRSVASCHAVAGAPRETATTTDEKESFRFGFSTKTSGYVHIATTYDAVRTKRRNQQPTALSRGRQAIDKILASLKESSADSNSLEGESQENEKPARDRAQELISKLQAEREKIKQRYAMGKVIPTRHDDDDDEFHRGDTKEATMYEKVVSPAPAASTLV